jgi:hypothetical protein
MSTKKILETVGPMLKGDIALVELLATYTPVGGVATPAIFQANRFKMTPLAYDAITVRITQDDDDEKFSGQVPACAESRGVRTVVLEIIAWTKSPDAVTLAIIQEQVERLLHKKSFALAGGGNCIQCVRRVTFPDNWDKNLEAYYSHSRYRLKISI